MEKQNIKNLIIKHLVAFIWGLVILMIEISDQLYYNFSDLKIGENAPLNLANLSLNRDLLLKKGDLLTNKLHITIEQSLANSFAAYLVFLIILYIIFMIFIKTVKVPNFKLFFLIIITIIVAIFSKITVSYLNISIFTLPFVGILGFLLLFYKKTVMYPFTALLVFVISISYGFSAYIILPFLIVGLFSMILFKRDSKDIDYFLPFLFSTSLLLFLTALRIS